MRCVYYYRMGVEHDDPDEGTKFNDDQCYALMQEKGSYCHNCITWSETSREQLQSFVRYLFTDK